MKLSWELLVVLAGAVAGAWGHIKSLTGWMSGLVMCQRRMDQSTCGLLLSYLAQGRATAARAPAYESENHFYIRPLGRFGRIIFQNLCMSGSQVLGIGRCGGRGWRPLWVAKAKDDEVGDQFPFLAKFIRGTVDWDALLVAASEWEDREKAKPLKNSTRYRVVYHYGKSLGGEIAQQRREEEGKRTPTRAYSTWNAQCGDRLLRFQPEDIGAPPTVSIDGLAVMPQLQPVIDRARRWFASQQWYQARKMPWRFGVLYHGLKGTGKTTLAREQAAEFGIPIHVLDLASMSNEDLRDAWTEAVDDAPCMVLVEDIDAVFRGRENVSPGGGLMASGGLTFDCLLNCVDGVERADGVMLVMTTNHPEHLDSALTRAGRIDWQVEFVPLDFERRLKVARAILGDSPDGDELAHKVAADSPDVPATDFTKVCCDIALARMFGDETTTPDGGPYR